MKTHVIIVNYHSALLTQKSVQSVLDSQSLGPVDITVVDNSADANESRSIKENLGSECRVIIANQNLGFGRACNLAFENSFSDAVLLLNPDAVLLPGALIHMQKALFSLPGAGAVGPQIFWDEGCRFFLPPSYPPELFLWHPLISSRGSKSMIYSLARNSWRRFAIKVWKSKNPVQVPALSGGHMLLKTSAISNVGGLFDPDFFMYFEDTDLCKRLRSGGFRMYVEPRSRVIHCYDSCGGNNCIKSKNIWMHESRQLFEKKHATIKRKLIRQVFSGKSLEFSEPQPIETFRSSFQISLPAYLRGGWLFEWSPNPDFIPSAGSFGSGEYFSFSESCWDLLRPGKFYGRIGKLGYFSKKYIYISWIKNQ